MRWPLGSKVGAGREKESGLGCKVVSSIGAKVKVGREAEIKGYGSEARLSNSTTDITARGRVRKEKGLEVKVEVQ